MVQKVEATKLLSVYCEGAESCQFGWDFIIIFKLTKGMAEEKGRDLSI